MICMTCDPTAQPSGCRRHGLEALAHFDLATRSERVELFLREYWPHWVTILAAAVYFAGHMIAWASRGFSI